MRIIGLTGFKQSGKDSTAVILADYGFKKFAFADALRNAAYETDPMISLQGAPYDIRADLGDLAVLHNMVRYSEAIDKLGYERAKQIPDFRRFLQRLGTDGVRNNLGSDAWVTALSITLHDARREGLQAAVITDVRFPNEVGWIHREGGTVWRINRPGFGGDDPHPSEAHIPTLKVDHDITADTLELLRLGVEQACQDYGLKTVA